MPKISIITTTYKHQDFIAETIESVLAQTFTDWELLIWDDSPDDKTWNIIEKYVSIFPNKIKAWHHSPNKWIVNNMNFLLEKVSNESEYIAFLEGDDMFTPDNLEEKIKIFVQYKNIWMIYNNLDFIDENSKKYYTNFLKRAPYYLKDSKILPNEFIKKENFYLSYSSLMIKKDILNNEKILNLTWNKNFSVSDWDLFFRISTKYNIYWIEKSLTLYRKHLNNFSWNIIYIIEDLERQINFYFDNKYIDVKTYKYKKSFIFLVKSVFFIKQNKKLTSLNFLLKSFWLNVFNYLIYKLWIFIMLFLPSFINDFIIKKYSKN